MTTLPTTPTRERTEELASERWPDLRVSEVESMREEANLFNHYWLNVQAFAHRTGAIAGTNIIEWLRDYPNLTTESARLAERVRVLEGALEPFARWWAESLERSASKNRPIIAVEMVWCLNDPGIEPDEWPANFERARSALSQKDGE